MAFEASIPVPGIAALEELDTIVETKLEAKPSLQGLRINKRYFKLYQVGFMVVEAVILLALIYMLVIKPFTSYKESPI
jgi:hypothetical protein